MNWYETVEALHRLGISPGECVVLVVLIAELVAHRKVIRTLQREVRTLKRLLVAAHPEFAEEISRA